MTGDFVDAQFTRQMRHYELTRFDDARIHNFIRALRIFFHGAQQQPLKQIHAQLFGKAPARALCLFDIGEQTIKFRDQRFAAQP